MRWLLPRCAWWEPGAVGQDAPTSPGPRPDPPPPAPAPVAGTLTLRVVSGADQSPVTGATILISDIPYVTNGVGDVTAAGVDAVRRRHRRPRVPSPPHLSADCFSQTIALWPVVNEAEADAVRMMVYNFAWNETLYPPAGNEFIVTMRDTAMMPTDASAWGAEASAFGALFGLNYRISRFFEYEQNEVEVIFQNSAAICTPSPAWGFCREPKFPSLSRFSWSTLTGERIRPPSGGCWRPGSSVRIHYRVHECASAVRNPESI